MSNITLLELNVPEGDIQVGPKSLRGSKAEKSSAEPKTTSSTGSASEDGRSVGKLLLVVAVLAVLAVMATKVLSEDADDEIAGFDDE